MLPGSARPRRRGWGERAKAYAPLAAGAVVVAVAGMFLSVTAPDSGRAVGGSVPVVDPISFSEASEQGLDVEFQPGCDEETGRVAIPFALAPECYASFDDNGGATADGVTEDEIVVVAYLPDPNDPILDLVAGPLGIDVAPDLVEATYRGYAELFEAHYQTYGRRVRLEPLRASGFSNDEVAARADAVKAAEQLGAFAVWGGPFLTTAWADELAAREVICIGCNTGGSVGWFEERAPYVYGLTMTGQQARLAFVEWLAKQVAGRPASFAGDPTLAAQPRRFGYLFLETSPDSAGGAERLRTELGRYGVELAESVPYTLDLFRLQEQAAAAIARFKTAGVTSVILSGDPLAPATYTTEATAQDYYPEWILSGSALIDTTFFGRTYDQQQWAHAFGVTQLAARGLPELFPPHFLYDWFHGVPPPAADATTLLFPQPAFFYVGIQAAGPTLTPETFRTGLFSQAPVEGLVTFPSLSFGEHGVWPFVDYSGIDDMTEVWWDAAASGPDELGEPGQGMYRYTEGGARYLPGLWPERDTKAFAADGAVALLEDLPPSDRPPDYPSPAG